MASVSAKDFFGGTIPPQPPQAAPTNTTHPLDGFDVSDKLKSTFTDVLKGAAKGAGSTVKEASDALTTAAPAILAGPFAAIPKLRNAITDTVEPLKNKAQDKLGLTESNLEAKNAPQRVGKGIELGAEFLSPLVLSKAARLPAMIEGVLGHEPLIKTVIQEGTSPEEVARLADKVLEQRAPTSDLKDAADRAAEKTTLTEKLAGVRPDIKARIKGKGKLLADYLNISDARNVSDLAPTPLEYAASFADRAVEKMQGLLSETGSSIGKFREKIATYQAPRGSFNEVRSAFEAQLGRLNLTIKDGKVTKIPGKIAQNASEGDISALQSLYDDLGTASENPSLENLIDLRNKFDSKVNFDKSTREVSGSIDPISRVVRKKIADVASGIVGKSESRNLEQYTKFMDALRELQSFTDRKAGAEFMLKRVLSDRGGDARAVMQTIKEHTGIDLMDHATMAQIATELGGNPATQGLFRQELTKAGLDAVNLLKGNPTGAIDTLISKGMEKVVNARKAFERAAR